MSMRKYYEIGGRRVTLKSSVHTWFLFKGEFGRELSEVISRAIALDELRQKESDSEKCAVFLGEEYRLWLSLLWASSWLPSSRSGTSAWLSRSL